MKLTLEINNCHDCPCRKNHYGHGECFEFCSHPQAPRGYDNILPNKSEDWPPIWCPISERTDEELMKEAEKVVDTIMNRLYNM